MNIYPNCSDSNWQPNEDRDTGWVCTAKPEKVKIVFWIFIILFVLAILNIFITRRKKPGDRQLAHRVKLTDSMSDTTSDTEEDILNSSEVNQNNK